jgi:hypothetical protein
MNFENFELATKKGSNTLAATQQQEPPLVEVLIDFIHDSSVDRGELYTLCDNLLTHSNDPSTIFPVESSFILFISTVLKDTKCELSAKLTLLQTCIKRSSPRVLEPIIDFVISNLDKDLGLCETLLGQSADQHPIGILDYLCYKLSCATSEPEYTDVLRSVNLIQNIASYSFPSCFFLSHIKYFLSSGAELSSNSALLVQVSQLFKSLFAGGNDRVSLLS